MKKKLLSIQGPTASGKSELAIFLAGYFNAEILSTDSRQFYKEMKIGTARPSTNQLKKVKHHFVGTKSIHEDYNASDFESEALKVIKELQTKDILPILVGGSGLYNDAVLEGFNPIPDIDFKVRDKIISDYEKYGLKPLLKQLEEMDNAYYKMVDKSNFRRVLRALEVSICSGKPYSNFLSKERKERDFETIKIGITYPKNILYQRIEKRCNEMLEKALIDEVRSLYKYKSLTSLNTIGYKEFFDYFDNKISYDKAIDKFKQHTRNYAKKQMSWLRRDKEIKWFELEDKAKVLEYLKLRIA
ncbi:MAG: tRNA (adenosine(37)-N6)-dimethylallyltransferase MiaA [Bacteroidota bacterium]|nr:tRNA (adenosine(37)-N6)-dimethylallyltransferase MiaA [Bacteroidota bacterium]